jgi:Mce-associated membrane protein
MTVNDTDIQQTREADVMVDAEANSADIAAAAESGDVTSSRGPRAISLSLKGLILGAIIAILVVAVATLGWLYAGARHQVDQQAVKSANDAHAEKIALDYALNAATMDFKDLQAWHVKLVAGTSPELTKKLSDAGTSMEQVLVPLQWSSTAKPLIAKVRSSTGGVYVVDSFVSVQTKTVQAPEALQSTATYSTTIDSNNNWLITDVGGIGSAMGSK